MSLSAQSWSADAGKAVRQRAPQSPSPGSACVERMKQLCADAYSSGRDAMKACMRAHKEEFPEGCLEGAPASEPVPVVRPAKKPAVRPKRVPVPASAPTASVAPSPATAAIAKPHPVVKPFPKPEPAVEAAPPEDNEAFKAAVRAISQSCSSEAGLFCNGVEPKNGRLMRCMMAHREDVGAACKGALEAAKPYAARRDE